jgi:hypothetical protein
MLKVEIKSVEMGDMTGYLKGNVMIDKKKYSFRCILFGNIGGQNVFVRLSPQARKWLSKMGYDVDKIEDEIQRLIVEGKFVQA